MKQKSSKRTIKKQNPYKVSKKFISSVNEFIRKHDSVLRELAER